jgi:CRISPR-associated protein Csm2
MPGSHHQGPKRPHQQSGYKNREGQSTPTNERLEPNEANEKQEIQTLIQAGGKSLVDKAKAVGEKLAEDRLSTSQIRNVYGMVKQMELNGFKLNKFVMLKPKLAYAAARVTTVPAKFAAARFAKVLTLAIDEVMESKSDQEASDKFENFVDFFEAILAYHKAAGGKNN